MYDSNLDKTTITCVVSYEADATRKALAAHDRKDLVENYDCITAGYIGTFTAPSPN